MKKKKRVASDLDVLWDTCCFSGRDPHSLEHQCVLPHGDQATWRISVETVHSKPKQSQTSSLCLLWGWKTHYLYTWLCWKHFKFANPWEGSSKKRFCLHRESWVCFLWTCLDSHWTIPSLALLTKSWQVRNDWLRFMVWCSSLLPWYHSKMVGKQSFASTSPTSWHFFRDVQR